MKKTIFKECTYPVPEECPHAFSFQDKNLCCKNADINCTHTGSKTFLQTEKRSSIKLYELLSIDSRNQKSLTQRLIKHITNVNKKGVTT